MISRTMDRDYEHRPQQIQMAEAVEKALHSQSHLIVEAGTGVGKSLAYLVPMIRWARDQSVRVVVATYTKTLQQQLVQKDLPFLKRILGDFRFALCVGGENYLCLRRFDQVRMHDLFDQAEREPLNRLFEWSTITRTGLRSDLEIEAPPGLWAKVCRQPDLCFGKNCSFHRDCYYQKAKAVEQQARVLIANHHLFFADMATGGNVLPLYKAVVFDEAHHIEDVATDYLGIEISNYSVRYLFDSLLSQRTRKGLLTRLTIQDSEIQLIREMVERLRLVSENFFLDVNTLLSNDSVLRIRQKNIIADTLSEPLLVLRDALSELKIETQEEEQEVKAFAMRANTLAMAIRHNLEQDMEGYVYWAERENNRYRLVASPIEIAEILREDLFDKVDTIVLTSATLSTAGNFKYIKDRLGIESPTELLLDSPFDFEKQAMLYISSGLDDQQAPDYQQKFNEELKYLLSVTQGRTLVLFTSYSQLVKTAQAIKTGLQDLVVLCQGDMPAYRLIQQFKENSRSVLFGTASFWQGIDIPGDALQCVVIAKLPFAVPDDPLVEARIELLRNPFVEYQVPQATLLFRQGFGRLIRSRMDKGVVAVFDSRIIKKSYGRWFLKSIPQCRVVTERTEFKHFFENMRNGSDISRSDQILR